MAKTKDEIFSEQALQDKLSATLAEWYYEKEHICRRYRTSGWKGTLMLVNAIGHLAEAAWHHPDMDISYNLVLVKLMNHAAGGITEKDFELAGKIEEFAMWQPGSDESSALEGTPDDDRYRYIKYE